MPKRLWRIQVGERKFGYTYGAMWLAVKEYPRGRCECGDSVHHHAKGAGRACLGPDCDCRAFKASKLLSFAIGRPKIINHRTVKAIIAEQIGWRQKKCK